MVEDDGKQHNDVPKQGLNINEKEKERAIIDMQYVK